MRYYFDLDGTIADLYGVDNWLEYLLNENTFPYENAEPLCDMTLLYSLIQKRITAGDTFGIVSWTSKGGSTTYNKAVRKAKIAWLNKFLPNCFCEIHIIKYGTPKYRVVKENGILFDDEEQNRLAWKGTAYNEKRIIDILSR